MRSLGKMLGGSDSISEHTDVGTVYPFIFIDSCGSEQKIDIEAINIESDGNIITRQPLPTRFRISRERFLAIIRKDSINNQGFTCSIYPHNAIRGALSDIGSVRFLRIERKPPFEPFEDNSKRPAQAINLLVEENMDIPNAIAPLLHPNQIVKAGARPSYEEIYFRRDDCEKMMKKFIDILAMYN